MLFGGRPHTTDEDVKEKILIKLRNLGNFYHNHEVLERGEGEIIPVYRPSRAVDFKKYLPCYICKGFFSKRELWKHNCKLKPDFEKESVKESKKQKRKRKISCVKRGKLLLPAPGKSKKVREILAGLRQDEEGIACFIKGDSLTGQIAERLAFKLGHDEDQFNHIRAKLREIGRLVVEYRKITGETTASLADLINPSKFNGVVQATLNISGFDNNTHTYTTPSLALKLGHSLKKAAGVLLGEAIMAENEALEMKCNRFVKLCELRWTESVSVHALRTLTENKRNNPTFLPVTSDVVKLSSYLKAESQQVMTEITENGVDEEPYRRLTELTLASILVFNRKRSGELSKMKLEDYSKCRKGADMTLDCGLSKWEMELGKMLWRVEIVGKKGRPVPILLTQEMKQAMDILKTNRKDAGVENDNPFMFPVTQSRGHIRGCDVLRKMANCCGAKKPQYLRSTRLRKHIATVSQILNLKNHELDVLANFMGHDVRVHRNFYRLPDHTMQIAKVSKLLLCMETGDLGKLHGLNLDDVQLADEEEVPLDDALPADEDHDGEDEVGTSSCAEAVVLGNTGKMGNADQNDDNQQGDAVCFEGADHFEGDHRETNSSIEILDKDGPCPKRKGKVVKKRTCKKRPWTEQEKSAVVKRLRTYFVEARVPGKAACEMCIDSEPLLASREWNNIKDFVRNQIKKSDPLGCL